MPQILLKIIHIARKQPLFVCRYNTFECIPNLTNTNSFTSYIYFFKCFIYLYNQILLSFI